MRKSGGMGATKARGGRAFVDVGSTFSRRNLEERGRDFNPYALIIQHFSHPLSSKNMRFPSTHAFVG